MGSFDKLVNVWRMNSSKNSFVMRFVTVSYEKNVENINVGASEVAYF